MTFLAQVQGHFQLQYAKSHPEKSFKLLDLTFVSQPASRPVTILFRLSIGAIWFSYRCTLTADSFFVLLPKTARSNLSGSRVLSLNCIS
jgi:hypothetical protein